MKFTVKDFASNFPKSPKGVYMGHYGGKSLHKFIVFFISQYFLSPLSLKKDNNKLSKAYF
jgi:hypothetical protein